MQKIIRILLLIIILIFGSCSIAEKRDQELGAFESVELDDSKGKVASLAISDGMPLAPEIGLTSVKKEVGSKTPSIYIAFGFGMYRAVGYASILSKLLQKKIRVHYLTGEGMGLVVAAMYAAGMTKARIEWSLYRFFEQLTSLEPYSARWLQVAKKNLDKLFAGSHLGDLNIELLIPLYNDQTGELGFQRQGLVAEELFNSLVQTKKIISSHFIYRVAPAVVKNVDIGIMVDALGENEVLDKRTDPSFVDLDRRNFHRSQSEMMIIDLPRGKTSYYDKEKLPEYQQACSVFSGIAVERIEKTIEAWQEKNR